MYILFCEASIQLYSNTGKRVHLDAGANDPNAKSADRADGSGDAAVISAIGQAYGLFIDLINATLDKYFTVFIDTTHSV